MEYLGSMHVHAKNWWNTFICNQEDILTAFNKIADEHAAKEAEEAQQVN